jgi:hypothetical protein
MTEVNPVSQRDNFMGRTSFPKTIPGPAPHWLLGWRGNALTFACDPIGETLRLQRQFGGCISPKGRYNLGNKQAPS